MNGNGVEKEEREETPLQGKDESRRSSPPWKAMDKSLEEEEEGEPILMAKNEDLARK